MSDELVTAIKELRAFYAKPGCRLDDAIHLVCAAAERAEAERDALQTRYDKLKRVQDATIAEFEQAVGSLPEAKQLRAENKRQAREIAERNDECVKLWAWVNDAEQAAGREQQRAERAEAERDALRSVVKAADAMRTAERNFPRAGSFRELCDASAAYDAARAKVSK